MYGEDEHILVVLCGDIGRNEERLLLRVGSSVAKQSQHWPIFFLQGRCTDDEICGKRNEQLDTEHTY